MSSEVDKYIAERYCIKRRVGKGAYGIVWKAIDRQTNEVVAVKKIFDAFRNKTDAQRTFREIMFLREFSGHPNIIKLHQVHPASNKNDIYLIFEYMETDLHNVIKGGTILKDVHKRYIMYQLLKATKYIHSGRVIHRDQKPSNILLDSGCNCKVADFGLARSVTQLEVLGVNDPALTDYVATRWYRAPEILIASKRYTQGIDMWSLGCILGEMLLGRPLFPGTSTVNQIERIMNTIPTPSAEDLLSVCTGYGSALLQRSPAGPKRPLWHLLRDQPLEAVDLVEKLLRFNPHKRLTAAQAMLHPYIQRFFGRFHQDSPDPQMWHDVKPPVRDDVQLSVEEYRTQLYQLAAVGLHSDNTLAMKSQCNDDQSGNSESPSPSSISKDKSRSKFINPSTNDMREQHAPANRTRDKLPESLTREQHCAANQTREQHNPANQTREQHCSANHTREQHCAASHTREYHNLANEIREHQNLANHTREYRNLANQMRECDVSANQNREQFHAANHTGERHFPANQTREQHVSSNQTREQHLSANQTSEQHVSANQTREQKVSANQMREQQVSANQMREQQVSASQTREQQVSANQMREQHISLSQTREQVTRQNQPASRLKDVVHRQQVATNGTREPASRPPYQGSEGIRNNVNSNHVRSKSDATIKAAVSRPVAAVRNQPNVIQAISGDGIRNHPSRSVAPCAEHARKQADSQPTRPRTRQPANPPFNSYSQSHGIITQSALNALRPMPKWQT